MRSRTTCRANYTHVARELLARGVNVIAHVVAKRTVGGVTEISLGSNPDVTVDLLPDAREAARGGQPVVLLGQVHREMPFMLGAANVGADAFDLLLDHSRYDYDLFAPPNPSLVDGGSRHRPARERLVRDGGTLQIGIGELGDSIVYSLLLRHQQNEAWRRALDRRRHGTQRRAHRCRSAAARRSPPACSAPPRCSSTRCSTCTAPESCAAASTTIYRCSARWPRTVRTRASMKPCSRPCWPRAPDRVSTPPTSPRSRPRASFAARRGSKRGSIVSPDGTRIAANLGSAKARAALARECLGLDLQGGTVMHAGFLLGPRAFYAALRELPESERRLFDMRGVGYINQLYGDDFELRVAQRSHARFVNTDDDADDARRRGV